MQLLGTIINIYQKQIVQDQILEEIIAVKPLLVGCDDFTKMLCPVDAAGIGLAPLWMVI